MILEPCCEGCALSSLVASIMSATSLHLCWDTVARLLHDVSSHCQRAPPSIFHCVCDPCSFGDYSYLLTPLFVNCSVVMMLMMTILPCSWWRPNMIYLHQVFAAFAAHSMPWYHHRRVYPCRIVSPWDNDVPCIATWCLRSFYVFRFSTCAPWKADARSFRILAFHV